MVTKSNPFTFVCVYLVLILMLKKLALSMSEIKFCYIPYYFCMRSHTLCSNYMFNNGPSSSEAGKVCFNKSAIVLLVNIRYIVAR